MTHVDVVAAVIIQDGRILLTQRSPKGSYPWRWESPGGKVEAGETLALALVRELREELGVKIVVDSDDRALTYVDIPSREGATPRRVHFKEATIVSGRPEPTIPIGLGWFTADELTGLKMTPANEARREELVTLVRGA